jgi:hypothetical protein
MEHLEAYLEIQVVHSPGKLRNMKLGINSHVWGAEKLDLA